MDNCNAFRVFNDHVLKLTIRQQVPFKAPPLSDLNHRQTLNMVEEVCTCICTSKVNWNMHSLAGH